MKHVLGTLFFCFFGFSALAQKVSVSAHLDGAQLVIGDRARLFIEARQPQGTRLQWAVLPDTFNKLEIVEKGKIDTATANGLTTYKQRLLVTGWDSGLFTIPSFTFTAIPQDGTPYTINTDSFQLAVTTVAVDTTQPFKPIKGIMEVKASWLDYLLYILLGLGVVGAIVGIIVWFRTRNKKQPVLPAKPSETLQQKTLRQLRELEARELWQKGGVKDYYIELTDILRNYLEGRFKVVAMESTTDEILEQASRNNGLLTHRDTLAAILRTADLAKFAKAQPLPAEHMQSMELSKAFVQATPDTPSPADNITQNTAS